MTDRFLPEVEDRLRVAGWFPGRRIADEELERLDEEKPLFLRAEQAIAEFGGVCIEALGAWCADEWREGRGYKRSFCIYPQSLMGDERLEGIEREMKRRVYPLGFIEYTIEPMRTGYHVTGEYALFIDEYGCVYAYDYLTNMSELLIGLNIEQALNNLGTEKGLRWWDFAHDCEFDSSQFLTTPEEE